MPEPRALWRQLDAYAHDRDDFCPGCGYYHAVNGRHRNDCTRPAEDQPA